MNCLGLKLTSADALDTLVLTFSGHTEGTPVSLDLVKAAWLTLEEMVKSEKVKVIGLSDVDTQVNTIIASIIFRLVIFYL
mgnify:CR=1 FL=1